MDFKNDIRPITEFRSNAKKILGQAHETKRPIIITQNGKTQAVLLDIDAYQNQMDRMRLLEGIARGKQDIENGHFFTQDEAFLEMNKWLDKK